MSFQAALDALAREAETSDPIDFSLSPSGTERRVRFLEVLLEKPGAGVVVASAALEWDGTRYDASAEGEGGPAGELRMSALATLRALEKVLGGQILFDLVGIKAIRVFDHDLVAVILRSPQAPDRKLIGVSLVLVDLPRAAALAVLNATNRLLGNYLVVGD